MLYFFFFPCPVYLFIPSPLTSHKILGFEDISISNISKLLKKVWDERIFGRFLDGKGSRPQSASCKKLCELSVNYIYSIKMKRKNQKSLKNHQKILKYRWPIFFERFTESRYIKQKICILKLGYVDCSTVHRLSWSDINFDAYRLGSVR